MVILVATWLAMAAAAAVCAMNFAPRPGFAIWAATSAVACACGALLLSLQPIGVATTSGRFGAGVVHWGFRVGRGRLLPAVIVSWLIWVLVGGAIIELTRNPSQPRYLLMVLAWAIDTALLLRTLGLLILRLGSGSPAPRSLVMLTLALLGMLGGSMVLWWRVATDGARSTALLLAGGPPLFVVLQFGLTMAPMLLGGRRGGWR